MPTSQSYAVAAGSKSDSTETERSDVLAGGRWHCRDNHARDWYTHIAHTARHTAHGSRHTGHGSRHTARYTFTWHARHPSGPAQWRRGSSLRRIGSKRESSRAARRAYSANPCGSGWSPKVPANARKKGGVQSYRGMTTERLWPRAFWERTDAASQGGLTTRVGHRRLGPRHKERAASRLGSVGWISRKAAGQSIGGGREEQRRPTPSGRPVTVVEQQGRPKHVKAK